MKINAKQLVIASLLDLAARLPPRNGLFGYSQLIRELFLGEPQCDSLIPDVFGSQ